MKKFLELVTQCESLDALKANLRMVQDSKECYDNVDMSELFDEPTDEQKEWIAQFTSQSLEDREPVQRSLVYILLETHVPDNESEKLYVAQTQDNKVVLMSTRGTDVNIKLDMFSDMSTAPYNTVADWVLDVKERDRLIKEMIQLLTDYHWIATETGCGAIIDKWNTEKSPLISLLRKHPNYSDYKVVIPVEIERPIDVKVVNDFCSFYRQDSAQQQYVPMKTYTIGNVTGIDGNYAYDYWGYVYKVLRDACENSNWERANNTAGNIMYEQAKKTAEDPNSLNQDEFRRNARGQSSFTYKTAFETYTSNDLSTVRDKWERIRRDAENSFVADDVKYKAYQRAWDILQQMRSAYLDERTTNRLNECMNAVDPKFRVSVGQKSSKVIGKVARFFGCDKMVFDMARQERIFDDNHNFLRTETRMAYGYNPYNEKYTAVADALTDSALKVQYVMSVHPIDYLTSSFGNDWTSCHTIDVLGLVNRGSNHYSGAHCDGTLSYLLDKYTMVTYVLGMSDSADTVSVPDDADKSFYLDENSKATKLHFRNKHLRELVQWGNGRLIMERIYPQKNDASSQNIYDQYRKFAQQILSTCLGVPNVWQVLSDHLDADYSQFIDENDCDKAPYADWSCSYSNMCKVTTPVAVAQSPARIGIGGAPIDIETGENYRRSGTLNYTHFPKRHLSDRVCACCGCDLSDIDEEDIHEIHGEYYCEDCYFYCDYHDEWETGEHIYVENYGEVCESALDSGDFIYCDSCERWYRDRDGEGVWTVDGSTFCCSECANGAGYSYCDETDEWRRDGEVGYCENCGETYLRSHMREVDGILYCNDCADEMEAEDSEE